MRRCSIISLCFLRVSILIALTAKFKLILRGRTDRWGERGLNCDLNFAVIIIKTLIENTPKPPSDYKVESLLALVNSQQAVISAEQHEQLAQMEQLKAEAVVRNQEI